MSLQLHDNMTTACFDDLQVAHQSDVNFFRELLDEYLRRSINDDESHLITAVLSSWIAAQCALKYCKRDLAPLETYINTKNFVGDHPANSGSDLTRVLLAHASFVARIIYYLQVAKVPTSSIEVEACTSFYYFTISVYERIGRDRFTSGLSEEVISKFDTMNLPVDENLTGDDRLFKKMDNNPFTSLMLYYKMAIDMTLNEQ